jgi:hypothetical protein
VGGDKADLGSSSSSSSNIVVVDPVFKIFDHSNSKFMISLWALLNAVG